jgi:hypothetical protein
MIQAETLLQNCQLPNALGLGSYSKGETHSTSRPLLITFYFYIWSGGSTEGRRQDQLRVLHVLEALLAILLEALTAALTNTRFEISAAVYFFHFQKGYLPQVRPGGTRIPLLLSVAWVL